MIRSIATTLALCLLASAVAADALVIRSANGRIRILGFGSTSNPKADDGTRITPDNFRDYLEETKGQIVKDGYDGIVWKRGRSPKVYPRNQVVAYDFSNRPIDLDEGIQNMDIGQWQQALRAFQKVAASNEVRAVFRIEAQYRYGLCLLRMGNLDRAKQVFSGWKNQGSRYAPEAFDFLGRIHMVEKKFDAARASFKKIQTLPNLPVGWLFKARLRDVAVDVEQRKLADAERKIGAILQEARGKADLANARSDAEVLRVKTLMAGDKQDQLEDARRRVAAAAAQPGLANDVKARAFTALGDIHFALKDYDKARYPYMRVVLVYKGSDETAHATLHAGKCFINLHEQYAEKDPDASSGYLKKGFPLILKCAANFKGTAAGAEAAQIYRRYKDKHAALDK